MIVLSSGHAKLVRGAKHFIDEVDESRRVIDRTNQIVRTMSSSYLVTYHDNLATTQKDNLKNIVNYHNKQTRTHDISLHFNSATFNGKNYTDNPVGIEIYYYSNEGKKLAQKYLDKLIKVTGLKNRGIKYSNQLSFLNNTSKPSILIELCFVNSRKDVEIYKNKFEDICIALAELITGKTYNKPEQPKAVYQVVTQSYKNKQYALSYQKELIKKGVDSFLQYYNNHFQVVTESFKIKEYAIKYQEELKKKGVNSFLQYKEIK